MRQVRRLSTAIAAAGALLLAGCQTAPQTRVTRFHLGQPIARGDIVVEPLLPQDRGDPEFQQYASIVGAQLARLGFSEAPGLKASEQVAVLGVERGTREGPPRGSAVSVGIGGGGFTGGGYRGGGVGLGGGVSFPVSRPRPSEVIVERLVVRIRRRSDGTTIWEGQAETSARAGSPAAQPTTMVQTLAAAVFSDFPGVSGHTVIVK